ncbi:hypothetical protein [Leucobacter komagatae]|uniref:Uncharacterized protein n=1 Tax=Leucobacter komagatae TaxID=55969 RepID=A0A0D0H8Y3_9MICO|nr:hypothetical protein [Leucobacter komagatae]KIP53665.1 hypothetical protein SD72_00030 [Leucobacter komagatae]
MTDTARAVERLTQTHVEVVDEHASTWPPLLTWLDDAVRDKIRRRDGSSGDTGVSIDFGMLGIQDRIKRECAKLRQALYLPAPRDLLHAVSDLWAQADAARRKNELTDEAREHISDSIIAWEQTIDAERGATPRKLELTVPCPQCGNRWILEADKEQHARIDVAHPERDPEGIRKPAVVIEFSEGRAPGRRVQGCWLRDALGGLGAGGRSRRRSQRTARHGRARRVRDRPRPAQQTRIGVCNTASIRLRWET